MFSALLTAKGMSIVVPTIVSLFGNPTVTHEHIIANVSAYTASVEECGNDLGITASGTKAIEGQTIAMDNVPFGTEIFIKGQKYVVEDRFGGNYRNRIDIYMTSRSSAYRFGRQHIVVSKEVKE